MTKITKTVSFNKIDLDLDNLSILKQFAIQANSEGWTQSEIVQVSVAAQSKPLDPDHFLNTLLSYADMKDIEDDDFVEEYEDIEDYNNDVI